MANANRMHSLIINWLFFSFKRLFCMFFILHKNHSKVFSHRFGLTRAANPTSSFLLHTPPEALISSVNPQNRYSRLRTQTPASILHKTTFAMNSATTTPLRGDQQPPVDDEDNDVVTEFIPLGGNSQPVTIIPKYFINDRDLITKKRIQFSYSPLFLTVSLLLSKLCFYRYDSKTSSSTWKYSCQHFVNRLRIRDCFSIFLFSLSFSSFMYVCIFRSI